MDGVPRWDMHEQVSSPAPPLPGLRVGEQVTGWVICHHPWGLGLRIDRTGQYGHVDVPHINAEGVGGIADYPAIGQTVRAVVLNYAGNGQLRLSLTQSVADAERRT
jgi:predicted RNA-binding protein with RPS1 domain